MSDKNDTHNVIGEPVDPQETKLDGIEKKQKLTRIIIITIGVILIVLAIILYFALRK